LAQANSIALDDPRLLTAAKATGADVPVCLDPRPRRMQGIGDILSAPLTLPRLAAVLINPGVAVPTRDVFAALRIGTADRTALPDLPSSRSALLAALADQPNDLEPPALAIAPVIADVLAALRTQPDCRLARMSGSGATCFGLFDSLRGAMATAAVLRKAHLRWWVHATVLNG
jgi:4-diphosphocytidyl-2-C-methyl-D-erythritol kinase